MRITAIDPGDRWVGLASFHSMPDSRHGGVKYALNIGVMDTATRSRRDVVDNAMRSRPEVLVIEEYRERAVGYKLYNSLPTPRLIGAFEYAHAGPIVFIPAGDPGKDVPRLLGRDLPKLWRGGMDARGFGVDYTMWNHGWSAWRCLALHLMRSNVELLTRLREANRSEFRMSDLTFPTGWIFDRTSDLSARTLIWKPA